jgi:hypothetical protein
MSVIYCSFLNSGRKLNPFFLLATVFAKKMHQKQIFFIPKKTQSIEYYRIKKECRSIERERRNCKCGKQVLLFLRRFKQDGHATGMGGLLFGCLNEIEKPYEDRRTAVKEMKKRQKEAVKNCFEEGETYFVVSFDSVESKVAFLERFGFNPDDKYVKGEVLERRITA